MINYLESHKSTNMVTNFTKTAGYNTKPENLTTKSRNIDHLSVCFNESALFYTIFDYAKMIGL